MHWVAVTHLLDLIRDSPDPERLGKRAQGRIWPVRNSVFGKLVGEDHWRKRIKPAEIRSHRLRNRWPRDQVKCP